MMTHIAEVDMQSTPSLLVNKDILPMSITQANDVPYEA